MAVLLLRGQPVAASPISINAADENAAEPYHQEMNCIDRVMQKDTIMNANEVEPALANCRSGASRNASLGR